MNWYEPLMTGKIHRKPFQSCFSINEVICSRWFVLSRRDIVDRQASKGDSNCTDGDDDDIPAISNGNYHDTTIVAIINWTEIVKQFPHHSFIDRIVCHRRKSPFFAVHLVSRQVGSFNEEPSHSSNNGPSIETMLSPSLRTKQIDFRYSSILRNGEWDRQDSRKFYLLPSQRFQFNINHRFICDRFTSKKPQELIAPLHLSTSPRRIYRSPSSMTNALWHCCDRLDGTVCHKPAIRYVTIATGK